MNVMSAPALKLVTPSCDQEGSAQRPRSGSRLLGEYLIEKGRLTVPELQQALIQQLRGQARLGEVLCTQEIISESDLLEALAEQFEARIIDLDETPPDPGLVAGISPELCIRQSFVPHQKTGIATVIATSDPARFSDLHPYLTQRFGAIVMAITDKGSLEKHISRLGQRDLSERANTLCPQRFSCRSWARPLGFPRVVGVGLLIAVSAAVFPKVAAWACVCWVFVNLLCVSGLRLLALITQIHARLRKAVPSEPKAEIDLPVVSIMVPLVREEAILPDLIQRLCASDYPRELLDICLVLEANDLFTQNAIAKVPLPPWFRVILVPTSNLQTKPRAMNYALDFCKGSIIGIYDAEDAPEADQIHRFVRHFDATGPETACIQGYLDFYNSRKNWLSRCFTIEYAIWFRVIMHGIEKMNLPVPLGGTTVFFRRDALEKLGAWDAHNVTEDADLGFRLARLGYRCAFLPTTTREEANCRPVPWIRQRSRWLKGYGMTWITHMQNPLALWRDLGAVRFLAFHVLLLGTLTGFLLAPVIWSLWFMFFGLAPAYVFLLPGTVWMVLGWAFVASEIVLMATGVFALSGRDHRHLWPWLLTMIAYWPLATLAAYKALYELLIVPFYWDKTRHGHLTEYAPDGANTEILSAAPVNDPPDI